MAHFTSDAMAKVLKITLKKCLEILKYQNRHFGAEKRLLFKFVNFGYNYLIYKLYKVINRAC